MDQLTRLLHDLYSTEGLKHLIQTGGLFVLVGIVFAETGLLAGFFLPGDSLLITAGIFAATDGAGGPPLFSLPVLLASLSIAAIVGDQIGYLLGRKAGSLAYSKKDSFLFKKKHLVSAEGFYARYGSKAIILARFVPIARTFVPFVAGVAQMNYRRYLKFDIAGGIIWICSLTLIGFRLGQNPEVTSHLHRIILLVVFVSFLPIIIGAGRKWWLKRRDDSPGTSV